MTKSSPNLESHRNAYGLFSRHDTGMFEHMDEGIIEHQEPPIVGRDALKAFNAALWEGFSDIGVTVETGHAAGEYTFVSGRLCGTNDGPLPMFGLDRSGKKLDIGFVEVVRWKDGKAAESWPIMDGQDFARQLGLDAQ